jgi:Uma2 family endonuclease
MSQLLTAEESEKAKAGHVAEMVPEEELARVRAAVEQMVTEDDTPVDNWISEKQMRLLTAPLYASWSGPPSEGGERRKFIVAANVGIFYSIYQPAIVPDLFLSLDVELPKEMREKQHRSYFLWEFGKPPEVVLEVVSNREGNEEGGKMRTYAQIGILYYAIHDPLGYLGDERLRLYELSHKRYVRRDNLYLPEVGLGLKLWEGVYESLSASYWLRWYDEQGELIPTGEEQAIRAEQEAARAAREAARAEQEAARAALFAARLRELGIDPDQL